MSLAATLQPPIADLRPQLEIFRQDFLAGLRRSPRELPPKYFYDAEGSRLFDLICELEEYFPARVETAILRERAREIRRAVGPRRRIVEFGSGSGAKTRILLESLREPAAYVPVEISRSCLRAAANGLAGAYPNIEVLPVCADYTDTFALPRGEADFDGTTIFFPGSTIGNFLPAQAIRFLSSARLSCGSGCSLLIGVGLRTDSAILEAAYNDARGVTAAFNRNILWRAKRELGARVEPEAFRHRADYNPAAGRIEMRLASERDQSIELDGESFRFRPGDAIITEYSHKFTIEGFAALAAEAGFELRQAWSDADGRFSVQYLESR